MKVLEAMSFCVPVVSTSKGSEGIDCDFQEIMIADRPQEFVDKINLLLNDLNLKKQQIRNARKLIETKYDWNIIGELIEKSIYTK